MNRKIMDNNNNKKIKNNNKKIKNNNKKIKNNNKKIKNNNKKIKNNNKKIKNNNKKIKNNNKKIKNNNKKIKRLLYVTGPTEANMITVFKDVGLAYYFSKEYNYHIILDDWADVDYPNLTQFRTMELRHYKCQNLGKKYLKIFSVFRFARNIDILYTFQIGFDSGLKMIAYRLGGGKGKIYLKLDLEMEGYRTKKGLDLLVWDNMPFYLKWAHKIFKSLADVISVETRSVYERLKETYYGDLIEKDKLIIVPNGVDSESIDELNIKRKPICNKEKIIITVGRLGTHQKNTELLLEILSRVNLKDWKVYLIGSIEPSFERKISEYYVAHPLLKENVVFIGQIPRRELYDYYNRARVFILTSRHESFAFVLAEAAYMHDYLISSNVGVAADLYNAGIPESLISTANVNDFSRELQKIIDMSEDKLNKLVSGVDTESLSWKNILISSKIGDKLGYPTFFGKEKV